VLKEKARILALRYRIKNMAKHILIIEDDKSILDAVQMALEFEGYTVAIADRGDYADKLMHGKAPLPDVMLLDILLSGTDGRDVCKALKAHKTTKNVPIIMMSAHPGASTSVIEAGADYFLPKPFNIDDLLNAVKKLTA
jgi:DNA-binding response OmpR family regulator